MAFIVKLVVHFQLLVICAVRLGQCTCLANGYPVVAAPFDEKTNLSPTELPGTFVENRQVTCLGLVLAPALWSLHLALGSSLIPLMQLSSKSSTLVGYVLRLHSSLQNNSGYCRSFVHINYRIRFLVSTNNKKQSPAGF